MTRRPSNHAVNSPWFGVAGALITALSLFWCKDLLQAWRYSPMDYLGWTALLIWLSPLLFYAVQSNTPLGLDSQRVTVMIAALGVGAFGALTSLNVLQHLGLALALAGWLGGFRWAVLAWVFCAVSWMPAFGWAVSKILPSELILEMRLVAAALGAVTILRYRNVERTPTYAPRRIAWLTLASLTVASVVWQLIPLHGAEWRLISLPIRGAGFESQGAALSEAEVKSLGEAIAVRRMYRFDDQRLVVSLVDATQNRHAVHDPLYCFTGSGWKITNDHTRVVPAGTARHVVFERQKKRAELMFWFSDGKTRHANISRYWWQTTLRRLTLGRSGNEPILVLLQSYDPAPIDWRPVLGDGSPFFEL